MFDSNILLTKFGPGFWYRIPGVGPGFYFFPPHDSRADKDSYPHDRNVTGDLCSLIKLCFAFIMVNVSTKCVLLLFMCKLFTLKSAWII